MLPWSWKEKQLSHSFILCSRLTMVVFLDLPDELVLLILRRCSIGALFTCRLVCTRLKAISDDRTLWSRLRIVASEVPRGFMDHVMPKSVTMLNFCLSYVSPPNPWILRCHHLHYLKYLDISGSLGSENFFASLVGHSPALEYLGLAQTRAGIVAKCIGRSRFWFKTSPPDGHHLKVH